MEQLMTVREVAARLKVTEVTVRRYISAGRIAAVRVTDHGPLRVHARDLERLLEAK